MAEHDLLTLLGAVADVTPDAIYVKDLAGVYIYANRACSVMMRISLADLIGTTDDEWFGAALGPTIRARDADVIAGGIPVVYEEEVPTGDRELRVFSTMKAPYRDASGKVCGIIGASRDITESRRESERVRLEHDMLTHIADVLPGALFSFRLRSDDSVEMPFASERIHDLFGYTPEELKGDPRIFHSRTNLADIERGRLELARSARELTEFHAVYRVQHPTRGERWVDVRSSPFRDGEGGVMWHGVMLDITDQKLAELRLQSVLDSVPDQVLVVDRERRIRFVNRVWPGYAIADVLGTPIEQWVHPEQRDHAVAAYDRVFATGTLQSYELRVVAPDGSYRWLSVHVAPMQEAGAVVGAAVAGIDITERKQIEEELRASRAQLAAVLETSPDIVLSLDRDMRIKFINRPNSPTRGLGTRGPDALTPETRPTAVAAIQRVLDTGRPEDYEVQMVPELGGMWVHTRVGPVVEDGAIVGVTLAASDMTMRREAARALHASQQQYQTLIDVLPDAVFVHVGGKITYANRAFLRMFGLASISDAIGRSPLEIAHPDDHAAIRERAARLEANGGSIGPVAAKFTISDGTVKPVSLVAASVPGYDEPAIVVVLHDLTALQRSDLMLRSVLESVGDAILTIDTHGIVLNVNPATTRMFGYSEEELVGKNVKMLVPEDIRDKHDGFIEAYLRTGIAKIVGIGREVLGVRKDGSTVPCDLMVSSFTLNGKLHFTGVMRDITARKRLEEQFRQAHKMEAFGQLAGGVAHDFNNLLTVILGATEMIAASAAGQATKDELRVSIHDIQEAARRASDLTHQLLAFSRKTVLEPRILDINDAIRETEKILRRLIGEDIALVTTLAPDLPRVFVDPGQLSQVVMNLCLNARDAMPAGGRLVLETSTLTLDAAQATVRGLARDGAYVRLAVRDTGMGMTEEVRAQVFQPFFTTKEVGRGTGLGLAVVHGVVTQSGGAVTVESTPGEGSTFELVFPAAQVESRSASETTGAIKPLAGHETVLVVEDDEAVRRLAVRSLKSRGYNVLVAEDGEVALRVLEEKAAMIDIAVVDVVMPRMDGGRLASIMAQRYPKVPVLFVSGYTDDMLESRGLDAAQLNFLNKPYTAGTLTQAVRRVLEHQLPDQTTSDST